MHDSGWYLSAMGCKPAIRGAVQLTSDDVTLLPNMAVLQLLSSHSGVGQDPVCFNLQHDNCAYNDCMTFLALFSIAARVSESLSSRAELCCVS